MTGNHRLIEKTADIVSAYAANTSVSAADLPRIIRRVHQALSAALWAAGAIGDAPLTPAVAINKSITADYLICLEDGRKLKSMKRHLGSAFGLTPDAYRAKWGLPHDYPMVAPNYSVVRSNLAREGGLGRQRRKHGKKKPQFDRKAFEAADAR